MCSRSADARAFDYNIDLPASMDIRHYLPNGIVAASPRRQNTKNLLHYTLWEHPLLDMIKLGKSVVDVHHTKSPCLILKCYASSVYHLELDHKPLRFAKMAYSECLATDLTPGPLPGARPSTGHTQSLKYLQGILFISPHIYRSSPLQT